MQTSERMPSLAMLDLVICYCIILQVIHYTLPKGYFPFANPAGISGQVNCIIIIICLFTSFATGIIAYLRYYRLECLLSQ